MAPPQSRLSSRLWLYVSAGTAVWLMLWLSYNTGPGTLRRSPSGLMGWGHYLRALFPFVILLAPLVLIQINRQLPPLKGPLLLWLLYGVVALLASISSPRPVDAMFWAATYLAVFAALMVYITGDDPLERVRRLNYLSWVLTTAVLLLLVIAARQYLVEASGDGSAYGVDGAVDNVAGTTMSRSSGFARFAAVPGVIGFTLLLGMRGFAWKALGVGLFLFSGYLIFLLQSRGAMFGFAFAIAFMMFFFSPKVRMAGIVLAIACAAALVGDMVPQEQVDRVVEQVQRGQDAERLRTMTGRTRAWTNAWEQSFASPIWGFGHQSDRYLIYEHVHNTYLYALLAGGFLGLGLFVAGLAWAWRLFFQVVNVARYLPGGHHLMVIQVGGIMAFFTVRSLPEVSGAHYSVDTMVLVPAIAYLTLLAQAVRQLPPPADDADDTHEEDSPTWQS